MNRSDTERKSASGAIVISTANTRLTGSWLIVARGVWLALVLPCSIAGALPAQVLHTSGFPASAYAALLTIFFVIIEAIWYGVGFLLFWRRSDNRLALLAAFSLVVFNGALTLPSPVLILPLSLLSFLGNASLLAFFLFFPNGRLVTRWMGLILLLGIVEEFLNNL
ncbi:MAG: hypothetical protein E6J44_01160, partial [Chloroflexi bacterium]